MAVLQELHVDQTPLYTTKEEEKYLVTRNLTSEGQFVVGLHFSCASVISLCWRVLSTCFQNMDDGKLSRL